MRLKRILNLMKDLWNGTHFNFTPIEMRNGSTCRPGVHHESHVPPLYHHRFLQGSLWVSNYSLKWKCSYSLMKPSAQIRHKSHSALFCPLNHHSVRVLGFCVLSMLTCFFFFVLWKKYENVKQHEFFHCPFKLCKLIPFGTSSTWFSGVHACTWLWLTYHTDFYFNAKQ